MQLLCINLSFVASFFNFFTQRFLLSRCNYLPVPIRFFSFFIVAFLFDFEFILKIYFPFKLLMSSLIYRIISCITAPLPLEFQKMEEEIAKFIQFWFEKNEQWQNLKLLEFQIFGEKIGQISSRCWGVTELIHWKIQYVENTSRKSKKINK